MAHVSQIKRAFGIDGVMTKAYAWRSKDTEQRSQIDLISAGSGSGDWSNAGLTTEREKEGFYASHRGQGDTESTEGERTLAGEGTEGSPNGEGEKEGEKEKTQSSWRRRERRREREREGERGRVQGKRRGRRKEEGENKGEKMGRIDGNTRERSIFTERSYEDGEDSFRAFHNKKGIAKGGGSRRKKESCQAGRRQGGGKQK